MKIIFAALLLFWTANAFAERPDARDSIILESKTVAPGQHSGDAKDTAAYLYIKVWITNKDTISNLTLPLEERSLSGKAYATLGRPRNFNGTVSRLASTLGGNAMAVFNGYNSQSPDSFVLSAFFDAADMAGTAEPPNSVRKAFWEIKFDSVLPNPGSVQLDSTKILAVTVQMVNLRGQKVDVNFVKGVITVAKAGKKGEPKTGGMLEPTGLVWALAGPGFKNFFGVDGSELERSAAAGEAYAVLRNRGFREEPFLH